MHKEQKEWCEDVRKQFPSYFTYTKVLDVGSLDVNGTNRYLFVGSNYTGVDVVDGKGVDVVCRAHELKETGFDVVLSTNALEHDMFWFLTLPVMIRALRSKGLMFFSCAYAQRAHGIATRKPKSSGTSQLEGDWKHYYRNLKLIDVYSVLSPERSFVSFMIGVTGRDLRFWGIKK